jgi:hypothetical protein
MRRRFGVNPHAEFLIQFPHERVQLGFAGLDNPAG